MIEQEELSTLTKSIGRSVREYVSGVIATVTARLDELDAKIKAIPAGPAGDPGPAGEKGDTGESIVGPKGETGERGEIGPAGPKGDPGERGPSGALGEKGLDGKDGKDGRDGRDGIAGKDGRDGTAGRDALQIEILPMIDPAKSYPRGTFAKHDRGLIRAVRNTEPISEDLTSAGWDVMVAGSYTDIDQDPVDPRWFTFRTTETGGLSTCKKFFIPAMTYKEIYRDGTEYIRGDVVTWAGSAWHCNAESTKAKPGTPDSGWKLMVKEGREGKPGKDGVGMEGPKGKDGRDGRDLTQMGFDGRKH